ncbi:MAG: HAMP domain-containing sensor histidine kinase [bacterium]|nr:HAMP domain-containing sensor histidine kinase [bacterium]
MSKTRTLKISIRTRILVMVLSLIAAIFLVVLAVFNLLVGEYIKASVNEQLREALQVLSDMGNVQGPPPVSQPPPDHRPEFIPDMRRLPRGPIGRAEAVIVSEDYELLFPDPGLNFIPNHDEISAVVAQLEAEGVDLRKAEILRLKVSDREYYLVSVPMPGGLSYLVYYIDMTAITSFSDRLNTVLSVVMGVAGVLAFGIAMFLSDRIAAPVRELKRLAVRIGKGDFATSALNYRDRELAELAESMNKAAAQLDAYDKEQKTFFQNVSHELRTPLQTIRCNAEGIAHGILDPRRSSRVIMGETDRLSEMVEDLLYLSRIDSITPSGRTEQHDLRELLSNCAERQRSLAAERNLQFIFEFDGEPVNLLCDEKRMSRAFSNLISNALRYARSTITLACRQENGRTTVSVIDDGDGIAGEDLPRIFDRFYKGSGGKHGIGLSIVESIIEQHNGKIEAGNTGKGAVFTIIF